MSKAEQLLLHTDVLAALRQEKSQLRQQIRQSATSITQTAQHIFTPLPATTKKVTGIGKIVRKGIAIYHGLKMARGFMNVATSVFRKKK